MTLITLNVFNPIFTASFTRILIPTFRAEQIYYFEMLEADATFRQLTTSCAEQKFRKSAYIFLGHTSTVQRKQTSFYEVVVNAFE